ncbi:MAG TPA: cobalamin-dependent protein [Mesotoga infera]|nr:cobalamin-dependent protein [Mesotoga infera]
MKTLYEEFRKALDEQDKDRAVEICIKAIDEERTDIPGLYLHVLTPALNEWDCDYESDRLCIWNEHVRSSIVRTVMECCYPYIARKKRERFGDVKGPKVAVVCPIEEYHEIGARMIADIFALAGYDVTFAGANTPHDSFLEAVKVLKPLYVAVSISNYYNLISGRRVISQIKQWTPQSRIIVGGNAFRNNPEYWKEIGADIYLTDPVEILKMGERDLK